MHVEVDRNAEGCAISVRWTWDRAHLRTALARDGAYLLRSDQTDWTPERLWTTYIQLTRAEEAFRAMKAHLLLRPMWHHLAHRVAAHAFVCVLAYALWKALDHRLGQAGLMTRIRKRDEQSGLACPEDRRMSPAVALRLLHDVPMGDILLETTEGRTLRLRRVARPNAEQAELLAGLGLTLPERICADQDVTPLEGPGGGWSVAVREGPGTERSVLPRESRSEDQDAASREDWSADRGATSTSSSRPMDSDPPAAP